MYSNMVYLLVGTISASSLPLHKKGEKGQWIPWDLFRKFKSWLSEQWTMNGISWKYFSFVFSANNPTVSAVKKFHSSSNTQRLGCVKSEWT